MTHKEFLQQAKSEAVSWARKQVIREGGFVLLDFETTGLDSKKEITQAGVSCSKTGEVFLSTLVKPGVPIEPDAARVTGIDDDAVKDAPSFIDIYPKLFAALDDRHVIIYNKDFDWPLLKYMCKLHDLPMPDCLSVQCAMKAYARYHGDWNSYYRSFKWQKLAVACQELGVSVDGPAHDAAVDCLMTLGVVKAMAQTELQE